MKQFIALLRGINVGGHRIIKMKDLRESLTLMGLQNVQTYIQSGNIVFKSDDAQNEVLETKIQGHIKQHYHLEVPVIVRNSAQWIEMINRNPFNTEAGSENKGLYVNLLKSEADTEEIKALKNYDFTPDRWSRGLGVLYIYCTGNYKDSKLTHTRLEKKLKVKITSRNWRTVLKLQEISERSSD